MPHLKTETLVIRTETGKYIKKVKVMVSTNGKFYSNLDSEYKYAIEGVIGIRADDGDAKIKVSNDSLETLVHLLKKIFKTHYRPSVTKEPVIIYNIESHISFAEDEKGDIFPNAGFSGAKWGDAYDKKYGQHHATNASKNGYSLTIGAKAQLKISYKYGDSEKVEYENYYRGGSHHGHENPAELLNSWCSFHLENFKEIPYSDESAMFFHNLMHGMAKLSQMIQENTFDQQQLLRLIATGNNPLLPNNSSIPNNEDIIDTEVE